MIFEDWWALLTSTEQKVIGKNNAKFVWRQACAAEREACAMVCQQEIDRIKPLYSVTTENAMKAIRARGQE